MVDTVSRETRSRIMSRVRGKDTGPEMTVRRLVYQAGYRYRLHGQHLPGKPDLVFVTRKKVIFVHGCFWHGHDCPRGGRQPKANAEYWHSKIQRTRKRDAMNIAKLEESAWKVLVIWECQLKNIEDVKLALFQFLD